jgi:hypothetical protein
LSVITLALLATLQSAEADSFEGVVDLEARHTVVPMVICEDLPGKCPRPEPYWVLSLSDSPFQVEWAEPIAFGHERRPSQLQVLGKVLKLGDRVRIHGSAIQVAHGYFVLQEIQGLELLE